MNWKSSVFMFITFLSLIQSFHWTGKYKILYPFKKQVIMNEKNNKIENNILQLIFHPQHRMYYSIQNIQNHTFILTNIHNVTDTIIMQILK
jgi:hypothetical protein